MPHLDLTHTVVRGLITLAFVLFAAVLFGFSTWYALTEEKPQSDASRPQPGSGG